MIKYAVLSDIHGNAQALEAVLHEISKLQVDRIIIAGDLVGDGPEPNRVMELIKNISNCYIIKGNKEEYILSLKNGQNKNWFDLKQFSSIIWTYNNISETNIEYFNQLKEELVVEIGNKKKIRVVHGAPNKKNGIVETNAELEKEIIKIEEEVLVYGHTHNCNYLKYHNKIGINPGSVGLPLYKNSLAKYGIIEINEDNIFWEQKEVDYDKLEYVKKMKDSGLLEIAPIWSKAIIESIFSGENISLKFLRYAFNIIKSRNIDSDTIPNEIWDELGSNWKWKDDKFV